MKPTNYHLFDFLDFDPDLSRDESLWKAYKPTSVYEKDGDICINVPFQKQVLSNDMAPDTASPRERIYAGHPSVHLRYHPTLYRIR